MGDLNSKENNMSDFDDMDSFAEECARRLAAEHERIATESAKSVEAEQQKKAEPELSKEEPELPVTPIGDFSGSESAENLQAAKSEAAEKYDSNVDLSQIMKAESYQHQRHEDEYQAEIAAESEERIPTWLRRLFSVILFVLGAIGVWILVAVKGLSQFYESLCFVEVALCLLISVGLNATVISKHDSKKNIMRTALWVIFIFYCLNAADKLFLHNMLEKGFALGDFSEYAKNNINFDVLDGLSKMTGMDVLSTIFYVVPYTFCVPVLMKSYRSIVLYFLYMTCSFMAVSTLQILSMSDGVSLAECLICLAGAAAVYIIVMMPPIQNVLRRIGLIEWAEVEYDDD